jgi:nucleotide-binding universal stress UspA family protein
MLVEMGAALAHGRTVQVVHLKEVPDITDLDALLEEEDPVTTSLNRRILAMSRERKVEVDFESAVTHDLVKTVHAISEQTHCNWLVAGWDGKTSQGLFVRNPIGWLVTHLDSNFALFKDNGVRYIRKILVAMAPGRYDKTFIIACDRIAHFYKAEITLVRVVSDKTSQENADQIRLDSETLLSNIQSKSEVLILRGNAPVRIIAEASASYDLLITGTPVKSGRLDVMLGSDRDKFADGATCSVLRLSIN